MYSITRYLPYHPGGPDELMRAAGEDSTSLFAEVHAWVNPEAILKVLRRRPGRRRLRACMQMHDVCLCVCACACAFVARRSPR